MHKKLTITLDEKIYDGLYATIGAGKISQFIENLIEPHIQCNDLLAAYKEMAAERTREKEAEHWTEGVIGDVLDETW